MFEHKFRGIKKTEKARQTIYCAECQKTIVSQNIKRHCRTAGHQKALSAKVTPITPSNISISEDNDPESIVDLSDENIQVSEDLLLNSIEDQYNEEDIETSSEIDDNDSDDESESEREQVNESTLNGTATEFFVGRFSAVQNEANTEDATNDINTFNGMVPIWEASSGVEWNNFVESNYPFNTTQNFVLQALVNGDDDQLSRRQLKKMLYTMNLLLKLKDNAVEENRSFELPALDNLWNYQSRKGNNIPVFKTDTKTTTVKAFNKLQNKDEMVERKVFLNLPSEHIRLATSNPTKASKITKLPDHTPDQSLDLHQGKKWKENPSFQHPMVTEMGKDYWVGDFVYLRSKDLFLIKSFHTKNQIRLAAGYRVFKQDDCFGISTITMEIPLVQLGGHYESNVCGSKCFSLDCDGQGLDYLHESLVLSKSPLKRNKCDSNGNVVQNQYYKVKVTPITLFSDDYSGNMSKQHNPYESWSMNFAGLPFEDRSKRENTCFIWTAPKTDGINALSIIPFIVDDLKILEKGVLMYSAEENEMILVTAPLMFIMADNPAHSDICGILGMTTVFPCRKCYFRNIKKRKNEIYAVTPEQLLAKYNNRTKGDYVLALDPNAVITNAVEFPVAAKLLSYRNLGGSERLLELASYNPAEDTPVEILHTILLGVGKYLVNHLIKVTLSKNKSAMAILITAVKRYESCKNYSRNFSRQLKHCGSFLGRDYKQLLQILPLIISQLFVDPVRDAEIIELNKPLSKLGELCSLVFVRRVHMGFSKYVNDVHEVIHELTKRIHAFDLAISNPTPYSCKPKMHLLHHLRDDLINFGCALHYETEKGEQFNKFLREHLFHTNRKDTSKSLALKFGKQELLRHIVDGGSWVSKDIKRVRYGSKLKNYIDMAGDDFFLEMFGSSREFADNNYSGVNTFSVGVCGLFSVCIDNNTSVFVGEITKNNGKLVTLQRFQPDVTGRTGQPISCTTDGFIEIEADKLIPKGALDMFNKDVNGNKIINPYKFNTTMLLTQLK
ncbi:uncharacterized protein EV154DRAFT_91175 [Mucor mucedo]|nr:uncharacterized protein EV154DRAFT_588777 [Mucor mucedo]XP_051460874.1 uncharacterized protein EV154DRAFT_91175 [Mucor mucedo]KAI7891101.1 hypothetical protein EV154DRAFT_588777 [Mucor mucedo]KAI7894459.1 hypothetical protein EV154DRAFT_91175 [Mucor mucedo]